MAFSLTENLPFIALPAILILLKITYDVLPLVAFLVLVGVGLGAYVFYAGNKSPAAQITAKRAEATADSLIEELNKEERRQKEEALKKQAAKDKKAAIKAKQLAEAAKKAEAQAAKKEKERAAAAAAAKLEAENSVPRAAPFNKSKKQSKKSKMAEPVEEDSDDDADEVLRRMAELEQQRRKMPQKK